MATLNSTVLNETPALAPPPGVIPILGGGYIGLQLVYIVFNSVCLALVTAITAMRLIAKYWGSKKFQLEDYAAFLTWASFTAYTAVNIVVCDDGLGRHSWDISVLQAFRIGYLSNEQEALYLAVIGLGKISILLQLHRIFVPVKRGVLHWLIYLLIWTTIITYVLLGFLVIFACSPRQKIWNPLLPGHCISTKVNFIFSAAYNVASDFAILIFPIYAIWHLNTTVKRKIGVSAVFATGIFACIASICRLIYSIQLLTIVDQNYAIVKTAIWSTTELTMVVICGSLPVMPIFFRVLSKRFRPLQSSTNTKTQYRGYPDTSKFSRNPTSQSSIPWAPSNGSTSQLRSDYVPLEELELGLGAKRSQSTSDWNDGENREGGDRNEDAPPNSGIKRTIVIESTSTPSKPTPTRIP